MTQNDVLTKQIISKPMAQMLVTSHTALSSSLPLLGMSTWIIPL